jgi:hypothetical protein
VKEIRFALKVILFVTVSVAATFACVSAAIDERHFVFDPTTRTLRGPKPKDDRKEDDCAPEKLPDGTIRFKCVVHFMPDYEALQMELARLRTELKACQEDKP